MRHLSRSEAVSVSVAVEHPTKLKAIQTQTLLLLRLSGQREKWFPDDGTLLLRRDIWDISLLCVNAVSYSSDEESQM